MNALQTALTRRRFFGDVSTVVVGIGFVSSVMLCGSSIVRAATPEEKFRAELAAKFDRLERNFSKIRESLEYEYVRDCKKLVREEMLMTCKTEAEQQVFVDLAVERMQKGKTFRFFEYYVLWLGAPLFERHVSRDIKFWDALIAKIEACEHASGNREINHEWAKVGAAVVSSRFSYSGPARFREEDLLVNWDNWRVFAKWFRDNRERLTYDAVTKRFTATAKP